MPTMRKRIESLVNRTPLTDVHTHLYSPAFGDLLLRGFDAMLTYHYLVAEMFRWQRTLPEDVFFSWPVRKQADMVWKTLFIEHSPVSESARGVLTVLDAYGLDVAARDTKAYRSFFSKLDADAHITLAMKRANVETLVMTNDPFDLGEHATWEQGVKPNPRFAAALRLDLLFSDWPSAVTKLRAMGFQVTSTMTEETHNELRRFLLFWIERMKPLYLMASLPPGFTVPGTDMAAAIFEDVVLPVAREQELAFALMLGCKRQINPALGLAGDGLAEVNLSMVEYLARTHAGNKFLLTVLSRESQHSLIVLARKFRNILPFGCWWFVNSPMLVDEITRMRLEWLGLSMVPQHSDARVLDQIVYKWRHFKELLIPVLDEKYSAIERSGWSVSDAELERDIAGLFGGTFWEFIGANRHA